MDRTLEALVDGKLRVGARLLLPVVVVEVRDLGNVILRACGRDIRLSHDQILEAMGLAQPPAVAPAPRPDAVPEIPAN